MRGMAAETRQRRWRGQPVTAAELLGGALLVAVGLGVSWLISAVLLHFLRGSLESMWPMLTTHRRRP